MRRLIEIFATEEKRKAAKTLLKQASRDGGIERWLMDAEERQVMHHLIALGLVSAGWSDTRRPHRAYFAEPEGRQVMECL